MKILFILFLTTSITAYAADLAAPPATVPVQEDTKTADQINRPLLDVLRDYRGFTLPTHQSICPTPILSFMSRTVTMDWHCIQLEKHRLLLSLIFLTSWALTVFQIVMSA